MPAFLMEIFFIFFERDLFRLWTKKGYIYIRLESSQSMYTMPLDLSASGSEISPLGREPYVEDEMPEHKRIAWRVGGAWAGLA